MGAKDVGGVPSPLGGTGASGNAKKLAKIGRGSSRHIICFLVQLLLVQTVLSDDGDCIEDVSWCLGSNAGNECKYWYQGEEKTLVEKNPSPFGAKCGAHRRCKTDPDAMTDDGWLSCKSDRLFFMCEKCAAGYTPTKYAAGTVDANTCPTTNFYIDDCYQRDTWTDNFPGICPTSAYRANRCFYRKTEGWGDEYTAGNQTTGTPIEGCKAYTFCSSELVADSKLPEPGDNALPTETYYAMCNSCLATHHDAEWNPTPETSKCPTTMITKCIEGPKPSDAPAPVAVPTCDSSLQRALGCSTELWMVAAFFACFISFLFLICYIFYAKRKRQKKKVKRVQNEAKLKQENAMNKAKAIEMSSRIKAMKGKGKLTPEEKAAKEERKAKKKEELKKRREEKKAILDATLEDGLPPGWDIFTDTASGQCYYVHEISGETSWHRPVAERIIEKPVVTDNPLQQEENEKLRQQMKMLVDQNRNLKKVNMTKDKMSMDRNIPIREAKKKKAVGMWKSGIAKAKLQARESSTSDKLKAAIEAAKAQQMRDEAQAAFPKPPAGPAPIPEQGGAGDNQV